VEWIINIGPQLLGIICITMKLPLHISISIVMEKKLFPWLQAIISSLEFSGSRESYPSKKGIRQWLRKAKKKERQPITGGKHTKRRGRK